MSTIKTILIKYPLKLSKISSTAKLDVEVILSFAINKPKEFLYTHPEYKLTEKQNQKFNCLIKRRLKNEPIAYITGEKEFYELNFIVNKNTLIPRPETELLVNETIKEIISIRRSHLRRNCGGAEKTQKHKNTKTQQQIILIDIGTGSGCIPISILKNLPKNITDNIQTYAIDISQKALNLAKKNARVHGVEKEIKFIKNDLLQKASDTLLGVGRLKTVPLHRNLPALRRETAVEPYESPLTENIIITANLPYISTSEYKKLSPDIKKYEPKNALIAGNDGLKYYKKLFQQIQKINSRKIMPNKLPSMEGVGGGLNITLLIEIDFKTMCPKSKLKKTIKQYLPNSKIEIKKDLGGAERVMVIKKVSDTL